MRGTITRRGDRTYRLRLHLGHCPDTGKELRPSKTVHGTKKEAERILREWTLEYETHGISQRDTTQLSRYLQSWLELAKKDNLSERTFTDYRAHIRRYLGDELGRTPLCRVTSMQIQEHILSLRERGLSAATIKIAFTILNQALDQAVRWRKINHNPAATAVMPRASRSPKPVRSFDPEQAKAFLAATKDTPYEALFHVALFSGARPGEYLGLGWDAVRWEAQHISVERAVQRPKGQRPFLGPTKTPESRRTITLSPPIMALLKRHRLDQVRHALAMGPNWRNEHNLVFPNQHGGIMSHRNLTGRVFKGMLRSAGLPDTFCLYDLRHTCATLLLLEGHPTRVVQERLGHASGTITNDIYSHVLPRMQTAASSSLSRVLLE